LKLGELNLKLVRELILKMEDLNKFSRMRRYVGAIRELANPDILYGGTLQIPALSETQKDMLDDQKIVSEIFSRKGYHVFGTDNGLEDGVRVLYIAVRANGRGRIQNA